MALGMQLRSCWRTVMVYVPLSCANFVGRRSTCGVDDCTSIDRKAALKAFIRSTVLSSGHCGHYRDRALMCLSLRPGPQ